MSDLQIVQTPIRYRITDNAARIGGMQPPYTIINLETEPGATVWFAHNPGLMEGLSTPLYAGSTLTWNTPGDFWAKCDMGMTCDIMLVKDITDWTGSGVQSASAADIANAIEAIPLDNVGIGQQVNLSLGLGILLDYQTKIATAERLEDEVTLFDGVMTTTQTLDVTNYRSLHIELSFDIANDSCLIYFRGKAGLTTRRMIIKSGFRYAAIGPSMWRATIPCKGDSVVFQRKTGPMSLSVVGSRRPVDKISQDVIDADAVISVWENANYMFSERANTLSAANTAQYDLHPWIGSITANVNFTSTAAMGALAYTQWVRTQSGLATVIQRDVISADPAANHYGVTTSMVSNGDALRFEIINNTAVNFTSFNTTIYPGSGVGL